jgi:TRAP-type C4-dicarboxylate transport system permease small subunit
VQLYLRTGDVTPATGIPLVLPHLALLFGFIFMAMAAILRIRSYASGKFD